MSRFSSVPFYAYLVAICVFVSSMAILTYRLANLDLYHARYHARCYDERGNIVYDKLIAGFDFDENGTVIFEVKTGKEIPMPGRTCAMKGVE